MRLMVSEYAEEIYTFIKLADFKGTASEKI